MNDPQPRLPDPPTFTPRFDANDPRNPSAVADAIADLATQVGRIADVLEAVHDGDYNVLRVGQV
jgi:hypothetical protein